MPSELRKVVFSKDEVWKAVVSHCMRAAIHMPNAPLEDVVVPSNFEPAVEMLFAGDQKGYFRKVKLGLPEVAAALIRFCREQNVPLPKNGKKVLKPSDDGIAMLVNVGADAPLEKST